MLDPEPQNGGPLSADTDPPADGFDALAYYRSLIDRLPPPVDDSAERAAVARLRADHPGQYIGYRTGGPVGAELVCASPAFGVVLAALNALPDDERETAAIDYCDPPAFGRVATPFRLLPSADGDRPDPVRPCPD